MHLVIHVTHENQAAMDVVLGRQWMGQTNCQLNWATQQYTIMLNLFTLTRKSTEVEAPLASSSLMFLPTNPSTSSTSLHCCTHIWIKDVDDPTRGWQASLASIHNQGYGKGEFFELDC